VDVALVFEPTQRCGVIVDSSLVTPNPAARLLARFAALAGERSVKQNSRQASKCSAQTTVFSSSGPMTSKTAASSSVPR
jgi:hypothetical protein